MTDVATVRMVAVAAEYQPEALLQVLESIAKAGVNITAYAADESGVRFFSEAPDQVVECLTADGFYARVVEVMKIEVQDEPGVLRRVLKALHDGGVQVIDSFGMGIKDFGAIYIRVDDLDRALACVADA